MPASFNGSFQGRNVKQRAGSQVRRDGSVRSAPRRSSRSVRAHTAPRRQRSAPRATSAGTSWLETRRPQRPLGTDSPIEASRKETRGSLVHTPAIPRPVARAIARPIGERCFARRRPPSSPGSGRNGEPTEGEAAAVRRKDLIEKKSPAWLAVRRQDQIHHLRAQPTAARSQRRAGGGFDPGAVPPTAVLSALDRPARPRRPDRSASSAARRWSSP